MTATLADANELFLRGAVALADIQRSGFRIDVPRLQQTINQVEGKIAEMEASLCDTEVFKLWQKRFRDKANLGSAEQLGAVLTKDLQIPWFAFTEKKRMPKVDESVLEGIDHPFVKNYIKRSKLLKVRSTFLGGIEDELVGEFVHPFYHLNTAISYRSSCSRFNNQNIPVRNKKLSRMIRRLFIPRDGHQLVEIDFKGIEVAVAACYHKDPTMLAYLRDPSSDMHRDVSIDCYMLPKDTDLKWWKTKEGGEVRYNGKNKFTFPEFYGSFYVDCARALWIAINRMGLKAPNGQPLGEWLHSKGITHLGECDPDYTPQPGSFEHHIQRVEKHFWEVRFPKYAQWKIEWYEAYLRDGGFRTLTGFEVWGILLRRNQVINYPVQGSAFHCLLWVLIQVNEWLKRRKMRSRLVGQIHDSMIADVHPSERDEYLAKVRELVEVDLPKHWPWLIVPMEVEAEVAPVDGSWFEKEKVKL